MYRVNFTCWAKPNPLNKKPEATDCIAYWYEEVGSDVEQLKANARKAWGENKGPKRFRLSQIVKGGTDILIEEHSI